MKQNDDKSILGELKNMKERMESLFSEIFEGAKESEPEKPAEVEAWEPPVDIWENNHEWVLLADLPGVQDEDLKVELEENQLTISGKREMISAGEGSNSSQMERPEGVFCRTFALPQNVKRDFIKAELKRGILTVVIPKDDCSKTAPFKVEVKSG